MNMARLRAINSFNEQEIDSINQFELTMTPMLCEVYHITNTTDDVIEDIYNQYLQIHQYFVDGTFKLKPGDAVFSGWAFNEYAENENEKFYKTDESDDEHHKIYIGLYENTDVLTYGKFFGRGDEYNHTTRKWFDNDVLKIGVNIQFLYQEKFGGEMRLHNCLSHEITHLYRSVVAPKTNLLYAKKNDIQIRFEQDLKEFKPLFNKIQENYSDYIS